MTRSGEAVEHAQIAWGDLLAVIPMDVTPYAAQLADAYNVNAALLGNTQPMTSIDVIEHYAALQYPFVLLERGELAGDGDLRGIANGNAELAFMIAAVSAQGRGLGTRFAIMMQAFAFSQLSVERVYASVLPENVASRRVFEKLGYVVDESSGHGDAGDIVYRLDKATFFARHAHDLAAITIS